MLGFVFGLGRFFGASARTSAKAAAAELRGQLARAAALYLKAGLPNEAARVMMLLGDRETQPAKRLANYGRAIAFAPEGSAARAEARGKRAQLVLAIADGAPMTRPLRAELLRAAHDLEAAGDPGRAADAYARLGDLANCTRALAEAGAVEALDAVLGDEAARARAVQHARHGHDEFLASVAAGDRRRAAATADASGDEALREQARALLGRRIAGPAVHARIGDEEATVLMGEWVLIGRAPEHHPHETAGLTLGSSPGAALGPSLAPSLGSSFAPLIVPSPALGRGHLAVARVQGAIVARDLGSRNGTLYEDGRPMRGDVRVGAGERLTLRLGGEVRVVLRAGAFFAGPLAIDVGVCRYVASLAPEASLGLGRWRLASADDGWATLHTGDDPPAYAGGTRVGPTITLLDGDVFATTRGGRDVAVFGKPR
ncbi:MAG TPA: hypothetical protein VK841_20880 [Polyangiaceae bacterium]|jgi:hypothetical protein|nr:hypothetical protein [Polyangiaceae bacterium]